MNRDRLSRQVEQDLEDLWVYLAQKEEIAAARQVAPVLDECQLMHTPSSRDPHSDRL